MSTSRQRRQLPETLVIRNDLFIYGSNSGLYILFLASQHRRRIKTEEKAKVVAVGWGDVLECRTNHLAARMYGTKVFGRTSIFVGLLFGIVWTRWSSIFPKHPFLQVAVILFILFIQIILVENGKWAWNWINFVPPNSSDDLCLLFCLYPSSMYASQTPGPEERAMLAWQCSTIRTAK